MRKRLSDFGWFMKALKEPLALPLDSAAQESVVCARSKHCWVEREAIYLRSYSDSAL
jgi:hypothetical protein